MPALCGPYGAPAFSTSPTFVVSVAISHFDLPCLFRGQTRLSVALARPPSKYIREFSDKIATSGLGRRSAPHRCGKVAGDSISQYVS